MPNVAVSGASIHYETFGTGPLLLLIPGADGRGGIFHTVAKHLSSRYTVICWDRRGYSKSLFNGPQDFPNRLAIDADDAYCLIRHLSLKKGLEKPNALVFGTSSGAVVAQRLLSMHPECVKTLISHEPACSQVLRAEYAAKAFELISHIYDIYRTNGPVAAMDVFTRGLSEGEDGPMMRECMNPARSDEIRANSLFWFEFELRQYPLSEVDVESIVSNRERFIPAAGDDSGDGPGVAPISTITRTADKEVLRLLGGHVGYMEHP